MKKIKYKVGVMGSAETGVVLVNDSNPKNLVRKVIVEIGKRS